MLEGDGVVDRFNLIRSDEALAHAVVDEGVVGPHVEAALAEGHHDPVGEDQGQGAGHGFKRPAQQQAPLAARAVLDHQQSQAADRPAEGEHQAEDPGAEHVIDRVVEQGQKRGQDREDDPDHQRAGAPPVNHRRGAEVGGKGASV